MWRVGDIKIELAIGHQIFWAAIELSEKRKFFTLRLVTRTRGEVLRLKVPWCSDAFVTLMTILDKY